MPDLPFLPKLDGTILLDVYTHSSLDYVGKPVNEEYGDNKRLADLGSCILNLAITQRLFSKRPMLSADEIAVGSGSPTLTVHCVESSLCLLGV